MIMARNSSLLVGFGLGAAVVVAAVVGYQLGHESSQPAPPAAAASNIEQQAAGGAPAQAAARPEVPAAQTVAPPAQASAGERQPVVGERTRHRAAEAEPVTAAEKPSAEVVPDAEPAPDAAASAAAQPAAPAWVDVTIPAGTEVRIRLTDAVSSQTAAIGAPVEGELEDSVVADGRVALPAGARVHGTVTDAHALKKVGGQARLALQFTTIEVEGHSIPIEAAFSRIGKSETGKDSATIAAGALVGAILGNQAKNNKRGKLVGGLVGAGAGAAIAASTEGETISLPAETVLQLHLKNAVTLAVPNR